MNTESTLHRLLRKRFTLKRRRPAADGTPRDFGVGVTGVVVTIVILGILAAIGGPPLWRLITDAREHKLNSNLQSAAQVMRDRLTLEPEWMGTRGVAAATASLAAVDGKPLDPLITALVEDLPFAWEDDWVLDPGNDSDETIRVEFIAYDDDAANVEAPTTAGAPPQVDWLLADWRAVRLQAANSDGAWACALIVLRPNVDQTKVLAANIVGASSVSPNTADGKRVMDAWLGGIWYDSGEAYASADASALHCSPVGQTAGASSIDGVWLPESAQTWSIHTAANVAKAAGRTFSRNL